jgi:hypothetical protein
VNSNLDQLVVDLGEGNINVLQVLGQSTSWTNNLDDSGLDADSDTFWDFDLLFSLDVFHD